MNPRLFSPDDAVAAIAKHFRDSWAERVCAELQQEIQRSFVFRLRPGVTGSVSVERIGFGAWHDWRIAWRTFDLAGLVDARIEGSTISVAGQSTYVPLQVRIDSLDAGLRVLDRLDDRSLEADISRARSIGARLHGTGVVLAPGMLKAVYRLSDSDVDVMIEVLTWLHEHNDLSEWTSRQLPVPRMHTKWLSKHERLIQTLIGRNLRAETRPRLSVVHFTYIDPSYLDTGGRHHDAWTTGDSHNLAYQPRNVLVVENRDNRLWFPNLADTIVVEGGGKAAASLLGSIDWILGAKRLVYWGDIDCDGFAILDSLRATLKPHDVRVDSILMDETARARYAHLGVNRDKDGDLLKPSTLRLPHLTAGEAECYAGIATAGDVPFRRIEQERIALVDAARALKKLVES